MNLNAIKSVCHSGRRATVFNTLDGGQWISNGFGAWLVEGVRIEGEESLMSLWNLSEKAKLKAVYLFKEIKDPRFTWLPMDDEEELSELGQIAVGDADRYICLKTRLDGLLFIDAALVKPVRSDYRQYHARWRNGRPMIAVYEELTTCVALILPVGDVLAEKLKKTANAMSMPVFHWPDEKKAAEEEAASAEEAAEAMFRDMDGEADREAGDP